MYETIYVLLQNNCKGSYFAPKASNAMYMYVSEPCTFLCDIMCHKDFI